MFPGTQSEFRGNSETSCANEVGTVHRGTKRYVNIAKQDPGKARQSS